MAGTPQSAKIDELSSLAATLTERVDNHIKQLEALHAEHDGLSRDVSEHRLEAVGLVNKVREDMATLRERLDELKKSVEEASRRRAAVWPALVGVLAGGVITFLIQVALAYLKKNQILPP
jgi:outer membrane murein-binding lipoprotein Lpp